MGEDHQDPWCVLWQLQELELLGLEIWDEYMPAFSML